jgi:hypothetical protein
MKRLIYFLLILMQSIRLSALPAPDKVTYESDGHYWTVLLVSEMLKFPDALMLAHNAELPDHIFSDSGTIVKATRTWMKLKWQTRVHALTGKHPQAERDSSVRWIRSATDPIEKGQALHRLGDSFAHTRPDGKRMYRTGFGHAFTPEGGHFPDKIRNFPDKYLIYVRTLVSALGGETAKIDMVPFEYIAALKKESEDNIEILKSEYNLLKKNTRFSIETKTRPNLEAYLIARQRIHNFSYQCIDNGSGRTEVKLLYN